MKVEQDRIKLPDRTGSEGCIAEMAHVEAKSGGKVVEMRKSNGRAALFVLLLSALAPSQGCDSRPADIIAEEAIRDNVELIKRNARLEMDLAYCKAELEERKGETPTRTITEEADQKLVDETVRAINAAPEVPEEPLPIPRHQ